MGVALDDMQDERRALAPRQSLKCGPQVRVRDTDVDHAVAGGPQQTSEQPSASSELVEGQPETDHMRPSLGLVPSQPWPYLPRSEQGLLGEVLRLVAVPDHEPEPRDEPWIAGRSERLEVLCRALACAHHVYIHRRPQDSCRLRGGCRCVA